MISLTKPTLTVFTSTYNRGPLLLRGYEALCRQTCKDFCWIIVDDGSNDDTRDRVLSWQKEKPGFEIRYIYKENGGMYTGYNTAIAALDTELAVCVDSDDYLTDTAVEEIIDTWRSEGSNQYAGIIALDAKEDGTILGDLFPSQKSINLMDLAVGKYKVDNQDRKIVVRSKLYQSVAPMTEYPGEPDFNPHLLHLKISLNYDFLIYNHPICIVEYQPDGMTQNVIKHYFRSPNAYRETRLFDMSIPNAPFGFLCKKTIHYISSCILAHKPCISDSPKKLLTALLYPFGWMLSMYIRYKNQDEKRTGAS